MIDRERACIENKSVLVRKIILISATLIRESEIEILIDIQLTIKY